MLLPIGMVVLTVSGCGTAKQQKSKSADLSDYKEDAETVKEEDTALTDGIVTETETEAETVDGETDTIAVEVPKEEPGKDESLVVQSEKDDIPYEDTIQEVITETEDVKAEEADSVRTAPKPAAKTEPVTETEEDDQVTETASEPQQKLINYRADIMRPIKITPDSTAINLLGNVIVYHNGAVITSDSAVRYGDEYYTFFKRVVINQDKTYVYGDRAEYIGDQNKAKVYAPIIKVVSDSAILYTYNMTFNTLDKVGEYYGKGTMTQGDNMMESDKGYYYTDTREVIGVGNVELTNPEYKMKSDSVLYNLDTQTAEFFTTTHVWNDKGDILIADKGKYNNNTAMYNLTSNAYILTENQEVWSDSLDYDSRVDNVVMRRNIQIRDEENNVLAFGDYGEYWGETEYGMLTLDPSLVSYEADQPDTLYMRSDSMFFYTYPADYVFESSLLPSARAAQSVDLSEEELITLPMPEMQTQDDVDGDGEDADMNVEETEELANEEDVDSEDVEDVDNVPDDVREEDNDVLPEYHDGVTEGLPDDNPEITIDEDNDPDSGVFDGNPQNEDMDFVIPDSLIMREMPVLKDSLSSSNVVTEVDNNEADTLQRVVFAYFDVRIYRDDFQAVCDSLVAFSKDSTAHLYINPVLWNGNNQVTSDIMDIYTRDEKLYKAEFVGEPFMAGEVDSLEGRYNQIKGKFMTAWFRDNDIYRHDVKGNGQVYYYNEDDEGNDDEGPKEIIGLLVAEAADLVFLIEERQMDQIKFFGDPVYTEYPIDKIPPTLDLVLPGFKWEAKRRPLTKDDVFNRTIRPSKRKEVIMLPQPEFPITQFIMDDKEKKIERGVWRERNDVLSQFTLDYIKTVELDRE